MPSHVVSKLREALSDKFKTALNGAKILVIGLSYKIDIDDLRERAITRDKRSAISTK